MSHADYLSRNPIINDNLQHKTKNCAISLPCNDKINKIVRVLELQQGWLAVEQQRDQEIVETVKKWSDREMSSDILSTYDVRKGVLYRKIERDSRSYWLPIVPRSLIWSLVSHVHLELKHLGYQKTLDKLYESYWFPNMSKIVKKYIDSCLVCKACKGSSGAQQIQLHSIPKFSIPWHTVHIDISGKLSGKSQRKEYVFVVIDGFTKYVLLRHTLNLDSVSAVDTIKLAVSLFGSPKRIIADQGRCFISSDFKEFCQQHNIALHLISTGGSRANGQVERVMQTLKNLLTIVENNSDQVWRDSLADIQLVLNSTRCRVTGFTPLQLMFGTQSQPLGISKIIVNDDINETPERLDLDKTREDASNSIEKLAKADTRRFNKNKATVKPFKLGSFVFLKCCERNQTKLDRKYKGPFKIVKVLENDRYELQSLTGSVRTYKYPHESLR